MIGLNHQALSEIPGADPHRVEGLDDGQNLIHLLDVSPGGFRQFIQSNVKIAVRVGIAHNVTADYLFGFIEAGHQELQQQVVVEGFFTS